jgi:hypothetical protein
MSEEEPQSTSDLDKSLHKVAHQASILQRLAILGIGLVVLGLSVAVLTLIFRTMTDEQRIESSCRVWKEVGILPVISKPTHQFPQTSKEGLTLILGAREAFVGQGCPGRLPKPSAGLVYLKKLYHL